VTEVTRLDQTRHTNWVVRALPARRGMCSHESMEEIAGACTAARLHELGLNDDAVRVGLRIELGLTDGQIEAALAAVTPRGTAA
jgi:hypothetical protein